MFNNKTVFTQSLLSLILCSLIMSPVSAAIYKVVKPDGSVIFTDRPQNYSDHGNVNIQQLNILTVATPSITQYPPNSTTQPASEPTNLPKQAALLPPPNATTQSSVNHTESIPTQKVNYNLTVISPTQQQVFRKPVQDIEIAIEVVPKLQNTDRVKVTIDGIQMTLTENWTAMLPILDFMPGAHALQAEVIGEDGRVLASQSVTFYIIQNTNALQQKRELNERLAAYNSLPWYQKIYLKLRGNKPSDNIPDNTSGQPSTSIYNNNSGVSTAF